MSDLSTPHRQPSLAQVGDETLDQLLDVVPPGGWRGPAEPRLAPISGRRLRRWQKVLLRFLTERERVPATNLFSTLLHAPRLFISWLLFASRLMPYGRLTRRATELVILRVAWRSRCAYEWQAHVRIGLEIGLEVEDFERVMVGPGDSSWSDSEAALIWVVDDIIDHGAVSGPCWALLADAFSPKELVEIVMLASHYCMLASVIDSLGVQVEQGA